MTEKRWFETDEAEDVAGSIRHVLRSWDVVGEDPQAWKWIIVGLHSALQGACVCHLTTSAAPVGALTRNSTKEWIAYLNTQHVDPSQEMPATHVMPLPDLLKAVRRRASGGGATGSFVHITDREFAWLKRMHDEFRNQFSHFAPCGWLIEVSGVPGLARLTARIITEILSQGWAFRHMEVERKEAMRANLARLAIVT